MFLKQNGLLFIRKKKQVELKLQKYLHNKNVMNTIDPKRKLEILDDKCPV